MWLILWNGGCHNSRIMSIHTKGLVATGIEDAEENGKSHAEDDGEKAKEESI